MISIKNNLDEQSNNLMTIPWTLNIELKLPSDYEGERQESERRLEMTQE